MADVDHQMTIKVIRYDLYVFNEQLNKKTKRGSLDVFYSGRSSQFYLFETWGYKHGKGFGQLCASPQILMDRVGERLQKKNLNVHLRHQWEVRKSFPKTTAEAEDFISPYEMASTLRESYLKEVYSESSIRNADIWLKSHDKGILLTDPKFDENTKAYGSMIDAAFSGWLPLDMASTPPLIVVDKVERIVTETKSVNEDWGAW
jgi:hypothetical protein